MRRCQYCNRTLFNGFCQVHGAVATDAGLSGFSSARSLRNLAGELNSVSGDIDAVAGDLSDVADDLSDVAGDVSALQTSVSALQTPKTVRITRTTTMSVDSATDTVVTFNSETWDTDTMFTSSVSNAYIECKTAGYYLVFADVNFGGSPSTGSFAVYIQKALAASNTTYTADEFVERSAASSASPRVNVSGVMSLAVGDRVRLQVRQSSGGSLNITPIFGAAKL